MKKRASDIVIGYVSCGAGAATDGRRPSPWTLSFDLEPWQRAGGAVEAGEIRIEKSIPESAVSSWMNRFGQGRWVKLRVSWTGRVTLGAPVAVLERSLGAATPPAALKAARAALDVAVVVKVPVLGAMTLEREFSWYSGDARLGKKTVEVCVVVPSSSRPTAHRAAIEKAAKAFVNLRAAWPVIRADAAKRAHKEYASAWSEDGEPIPLARIEKAMKPSGVHFDPNASVMISCGDVFGDHAIEADLTSTMRVKGINLV